MRERLTALFGTRRFGLAVAALSLCVYLALAVGNAAATSPWCDEAWFADPAYNLVRKGHMGTTSLAPTGSRPPMALDRIHEHTYWVMPLHLLALASWYKVLGFGMVTTRLLSVLWGAVVVTAVASLARQLTGSRAVALLTLPLLGLDYYFLTRAADGRMDMMAAGLAFSALAAYAGLRERHLARAVLAGGSLAAASAFTHPMGGFAAVTGLLFLALLQDRHRLRWHHAALVALPFLLGAGTWGAYIAQDLPAFRAQMGSNGSGRLAALTSPGEALRLELTHKYLGAFGLNSWEGGLSPQHLRLLVLAAYLAALAGLASVPALRRRPGHRALLLLTLTEMLALAVLDGHKRVYYLVYIVPLFAAVLACALHGLWESRRVPAAALGLGVCVLLALQVSGTLYRISQNRYRREYLPLVEFVQRAGGDASIIGGAELGFGLGFPPNLRDDVSLGYHDGRRPALIFFPEMLYGVWLREMETTSPAVFRHVQRLLTQEYYPVYDRAGYRVYARLQPQAGNRPQAGKRRPTP